MLPRWSGKEGRLLRLSTFCCSPSFFELYELLVLCFLYPLFPSFCASCLILTLRSRLSQMILDKVFHGVLDQGRGCLLVFDQPEADVSPCSLPYSISYLLFELYVFGIQNTYGAAIDTLEQVGKVVDSLYAKVRYFVITSLFFCASFCRSFIDSSSFRFTRFLGQCANDPK